MRFRVRVNRYIIVFMNMLTNIFGYGIIKNEKEARLSEGKKSLGSERSGNIAGGTLFYNVEAV